MQYILNFVKFFMFVSAVTTPVTYPEDITEGAKLFSLVNGVWVFGIMVLLTLIIGAYALRKPVKVRTLLCSTIGILSKEKFNAL